jgi:mannosyltransferase
LHNANVQESIAGAGRFLKPPFRWPFLFAILAAIYALIGSGESLWLDELHSSWVVSGRFSEISERAAQGNQSPVYFALLWGIQAILGGTLGMEIALRLPSILAWAVAIGLLVRNQIARAEAGKAMLPESSMQAFASVAIVVAWILLDRIQLFYATEARVYGTVQLLSLVGWLVCMRLMELASQSDSSPEAHPQVRQVFERDRWIVAAWFACSVLLIYLHLTAGLAVFAQWISLSVWAVCCSTRRLSATVLLAGVAVGLASIPAVLMAQPVWVRREQWTSFAGDASFGSLIHLFPLLALLVPILMALVIQRLIDHRASPVNVHQDRQWIVWLVAAMLPWLLSWLVTFLEIAPVFHRRFVIMSALPLVMLAASWWNRVHVPLLKYAAGGAVLLWLVLGQGSLAIWMQGDIVGWQRVEGWRQAALWIERRIAPGESLWVASGLIEGREASLPLSAEFERYLSYPLRGAYRVRDRLGAIQEPHALANDWRLWEQQWRTQNSAREKLWIIYRGPAERFEGLLEKIVAQSEQREFMIVGEPKSFGRVAVAVLRWVDLPNGSATASSSAIPQAQAGP